MPKVTKISSSSIVAQLSLVKSSITLGVGLHTHN
jgi:hypothetical protein